MSGGNRYPLGSIEQAIEDGEIIVASRKAASYAEGVDDSFKDVINRIIDAKFNEDVSEILKEHLTRYQLEKILEFVATAKDFTSCKDLIIKNIGYHKR